MKWSVQGFGRGYRQGGNVKAVKGQFIIEISERICYIRNIKGATAHKVG